MKQKNIIIGIITVVFIALISFFLFINKEETNTVIKKDTTKKERKVLYWKAPMNPNEIYDNPGKSRMGMDLMPVYEDETDASGIVKIDGTLQQNMNVKTYLVENKDLSPVITTNGILQTDERKEFVVTTKVGGWVEKLYVNFTGQKIKKGQKLIDIYSPKLVAAEQEFLTAISYAENVSKSENKSIANTGKDLIKNSIKKLELLDISKKEIENLRRTKQVKRYVTLYAPFDGTVITKNVIAGKKINPGTPLLKIADLKNLWLIADIYEYELSQIKVGSNSEIKFNFMPWKSFESKVAFIYPTLNPKTRTAKIRIDIKNNDGKLKPSMFASINIEGLSDGMHPVIPEQSVIRSGQEDIVILKIDEGKFRPVEVKLGNYSQGNYQVLEGLEEGNEIVTSAQFLIDSESNLKAALNQFKSSKPKTYKLEIDEKDTAKTESELIRKGIIHLDMIDVNKDGKLYQDVMDWNVLSDKPGVCPECGMTLREFTIEQVKENLKKHGYKFK